MSANYSVLGAFFASRLLCSLFVYLGHTQRTYLSPVPGGWEGVPNWWLNPWTTYDSTWYLQIAASGYQEHTTAFFPLYPWLLRLPGNDLVTMAATGVFISHFSLLVALWLVFKLTELEWSTQHAHATVWLLAFTPAAPFFGAVYTESLFIALLAGTFLAARRRHWWLAGLLAAIAALLRNPGFLIAGALFLDAWLEKSAERSTGRWFAWTFPLAVFLAVQGSFWFLFDSALAGVDSQSFFHRQPSWPYKPLVGDLYALVTMERGPVFCVFTGTTLTASVFGLFVVVIGWRHFRWSYLLLIVGVTLMNLAMMRELLPHTAAAVRYMGALFPVAQIFAWILLEKLSQFPKMKMALIGAHFFLFIMFSYLFGTKSFLG